MAQSSSRFRHFPEPAAKLLVAALLRDILEHCRSHDMEVCNAGLYAARDFIGVCAAHLQEAAARVILGLMEQNLHSPASTWGWAQQMSAISCLSRACNALNTVQQQRCMALLASMTEHEVDWRRQMTIISEIQVFWKAVADPWSTYAATAKQLEQMERSVAVHPYVRSKLDELL